MSEQQAFILRIKPRGRDRVKEALKDNQIIIGWAKAEGLIEEGKYRKFREIIRKTYYPEDRNLRGAGNAAGHMWRFIKGMNEGDLVVVPCSGSKFYVAEVTGPATYDPAKVCDDTAYRRSVQWLNNKEPIPRSSAKAALRRKMKSRGTCSSADEVLSEIKECLSATKSDSASKFYRDLRKTLMKSTHDAMQKGHLDDDGFEYLIKKFMEGMGGKNVQIIARKKDVGVGLIATFDIAGILEQKIAIQAKQFLPKPGVKKEVVEELINGIEKEGADIGMVITTGTISDEAEEFADNYTAENGIKIELINGERFAEIIVDNGLEKFF